MDLDVDDKGQLSLEYVLLSMMAILIISLVSVPIYCYSSGKGSKRLVYVDFNRDVDVKLSNNGKKGLASINLSLSDNAKEIKSSFDYVGLNENIHLSKGFNKILVKWDEESNRIEVNRAI